MLRTHADRHRAATNPGRSADADDVALIARVARGDMPAFEAFYRRYHARLHRFLALVTRRDAVVEEAVNDTLLVVWNRSSTYNGQSKVSTWVFAIAYRTALKALRCQDEPVAAGDTEPLSDAHGPEQQRSDGERRLALAEALSVLSGEQRSVLVLTYFHDLPYAEIAQIVGCPVDTVKTRAFHGRRRLRALLAGELRDWL